MNITLFFSIFLLFAPSCAFALQTHGGPEGLYIHLVSHVIFFIAMISLSVWVRRSGLRPVSAWRAISSGAVILACWNVWAFAGHVMEGMVGYGSYMGIDSGQIPCIKVTDWKGVIFYLLKLDHLLYFPAIYLFYVGLRRLRTRGDEGGA